MVWRKTSPLARQLLQFSEVVRLSAATLRKQRNPGSASRYRRT
jgi:LysR family hydrogen peroxide-inducible transcriptional activator